MAIDDFYSNLLFVLRWLHILFGIIWIGHLYFFNFVNVPFQGGLAKELKPQVNPALLGRALWWFRWGAMMTFLLGIVLFTVKYMGNGAALMKDPEGGITERSMWIMWGGLLGTIMWFNVWFVIWPAQKQLLGWMKAGVAAPEAPALAKRALLFSRINTYLSGPMLFAMIAPNNYPSINVVTLLFTIVVGGGVMWGFIRMSHKVGQDI